MKNPTNTIKTLLLAGIAAALFAGRTNAGHAPAVSPNQKRADVPLEDRILGYWAPNWDAMAPIWKPTIEGLAGLTLGDRSKAARDRVKVEVADEMKEGFRVMTMEFIKDKHRQHTGPGRIEEQSCVVKKTDRKTGTLQVELTSPRGGPPERAKLVLAGNRLTFIGQPEANSAPYILDRIDKQEFRKRQAAAAKSKLFKPTIKFSGKYTPPNSREK